MAHNRLAASRVALFALALLATACASKPAEPSGAGDVEAFLKRYTEVWNTYDHATLARDFWRTGPSEAEESANLARSFQALHAQGYHHSDIYQIKGCMTGPDTAWGAMKYSRLTAANEPLPPKDRASSYELKKFADGWRITKVGNYDAAAPLACPG